MKTKIFQFQNWKLSYFGSALIICALIILSSLTNHTFQKEDIQQQFLQLEGQAKTEAKQLLKQFKEKRKLSISPEFYYHFYDGERLFGWRNNQLPVGRYKSDLFPTNGLTKLKNGWYYATTITDDSLSCCVSFCLQHSYELQNDYLKEGNPSFWTKSFQLFTNGQTKDAILNNQGQVVCYARPNPTNHDASFPLLAAPLMLIIGLFLILYNLYQLFQGHMWATAGLLVFLMFLRLIFYELNWPLQLQESDWFSASFFAFDEWTPNFFAFVINGLFIGFGLQFILSLLKKTKFFILYFLIWCFPFIFWIWVSSQLNLILEHSNIPVNFEHIFELKLSSFVFFTLIGLYFYQFQQMLSLALQVQFSKNTSLHQGIKIGIVLLPFILYFIADTSWLNALPIFTIFLNVVLGKNSDFSWFRLSRQLLMLSLASFILSLHLQTFVKQKEIENRRLFAQQLALERNINLELSFSQIVPEIQKEKWLLSEFDSLKKQMTKVSFEHILSQKFFQGVWDGFEIESDLFDKTQKPCFGNDTNRLADLYKLVRAHGQPSEIEEGIYFMPHEEQGLSYIILLPLSNDKILGLTLISKQIPEEMGFPRLLISNQAGISSSLEKYAIGKYAEGRLIHQSGDFNFPNTLASFPKKLLQKSYFEFKGFEHTVILSGAGSAIFIATPQSHWLNLITSFAFIFVFWGALTILLNMISNQGFLIGKTWSLSLKIQIAFLVILVISLFLYGLGSSIFIGQQFDAYAQQALKEKLNAVKIELNNQIGHLDTLDAEKVSFQLEAKTAKLSSVFNTDLFIYDADGFLISSSRPKLFAFGLVGEHMDATAMDALIGKRSSYFSHQEQIGSLKFRSAYIPLMNEKRDLLGFINLQLFGQQQAYEQQIEEFLKAAINVFILLLALSVFIALIVSNWLIGPLQVVAKSVKNIEFGKKNQRISYQNKDEIGAIVQSYNEKLIELEAAALKLAKSERESAWRDLAQQIAHEIKNPLTPMKLSIQHLLRNLENGHPNTIEQAKRTLPSLIEQIDGLATMANEFAQFAKLPEAQLESLELVQFVKGTLSLFDNQSVIKYHSNVEEVLVKADKKMLGQVLNNLLTNAFQATQESDKAQIDVSINTTVKHVVMSIKDNGVGMNESAKQKIFTPYFTTKSSGSGIGLIVVRQILEKHGGQIHFESEEGKGSCFYVTLPLLT